MKEISDERQQPVKAVLVGAPLEVECDRIPLTELQGLVSTLEMDIVDSIILPRREPTPQFGIGTGKAAEIAERAKEKNADCIIFDFEINPTQQRNWEKLAQIPVFDRHEVILRIFASRAQTKEAVLQVELAKLTYSLPRLAHTYGDMARQRGGSYGSKGSGETQLELDRRGIQEKIGRIKKELEKVVQERDTRRKRRDKIPLSVCALVGYTNAGKSSLLNALTGAEVFVENKLFATLDPTTRRLDLEGGEGLLLTDTVGFISNLPHSLVDAFKSTLEEAERADLQLLVLDASNPDVEFQYETVLQVLTEIKADKNKRIVVLNKTDIPVGDIRNRYLKQKFPDALWVSAKDKNGLDLLAEKMTESIFGPVMEYEIPLTQSNIIQDIRKNGVVLKTEWNDTSLWLQARTKGKEREFLSPYQINGHNND